MAVSKHTVKLVATTGQEKGVVLRIQRDGLWLFTEGGKVSYTCTQDLAQTHRHDDHATTTAATQQQQRPVLSCDEHTKLLCTYNPVCATFGIFNSQEIQLLPYQHIVKWLPSNLRSKDPGPDDCLDVQVETTSGKKDLRMRCADVQSVQTIISDIRSTVQVQTQHKCMNQIWAPPHTLH